MIHTETQSHRQIFTQYATFHALSDRIKRKEEKVVEQVQIFTILVFLGEFWGILPVILNFLNQGLTFMQ